MAYVLLGIAIICELIGTTLVKQSLGFTKLIPTIGCLLAYFMSFFLFLKALNSINLGAAYATWSAVGIVASNIISVLLFGERLNIVGIISLALIITGCIILNLFGIAQK